MKKLVVCLIALILLGALPACERETAEVVPDPSPSVSVSPTPTSTPAPSPTPPPTAEDIFPREFTFMNGMGDWRVNLKIEADGSFIGHEEARTWLSMEADEEGAKGFTDFKGKFSIPEQVNDYTYAMKLEEFQIEPGEETVIDGFATFPITSTSQDLTLERNFSFICWTRPWRSCPRIFFCG